MRLDRAIDPNLLEAAGIKPKPKLVLSQTEHDVLSRARQICARAARLTGEAEFQQGLYYETEVSLAVLLAKDSE